MCQRAAAQRLSDLNLLADGRVRLGLRPTRDVVVDGTAEPVDLADPRPQDG
ncbi:hypothetical protein [Streptosporangium sp. NPDC001681]|uniref:hypothetical protein n=1 Tax=Streptosporangium sp. NPDC001681 TaxID=3154395 RepID=UPI0033167AB8